MKTPPTLVLVHGYPFDHTMWEPTVQHMGRRVRVLVPDLPGFGDDPLETTAEPSIEGYAEALNGFLHLHDLKQAVIAGMSMGGYVALQFAKLHPEKVVGLGLISTQAQADTEEGKQNRRALIAKLHKEGPRVAVDAVLPKLFSAQNPVRPELERYVRDAAERAGVEGLSWALEAMARRPDLTGFLPKIQCPALVLHGTADQLIPTERAQSMASAMPNATFQALPGVGHASPLEAPDLVANALVELVQRSLNYVPLPPHSEVKSNRPGVVWSPTDRGL